MMVFGNKSEHSGTGVAFSRNPATGEAVFYGEYLEQVRPCSLLHSDGQRAKAGRGLPCLVWGVL